MQQKLFCLGALAIAVSGCAGFVPSAQRANGSGRAPVEAPRWAAEPLSAPARCTNRPYAFQPTGKLRHTRNKLFVVGLGDARAHGRDALVKLGADAVVEAKFSYGKFAKDLEDEDVALFVRDDHCEWTRVGTSATDDRGIATFKVPASQLPAKGRYAFEAVLLADGEAAPGAIYVIDGTTKAVVFDVDETLTTGNGELIEQLMTNATPDMRPDADKIVKAWSDAGWFVAYVTGRPHQFTDITRKWLTARGFPPGLLRTSESLTVSFGEATQHYKERTLVELKKAGLDVQYAYGNSPSDICAYAHSAIDPRQTFILGTHAGEGCPGATRTLALSSYTEQLGAPIMRLAGTMKQNTVATNAAPAAAVQ